MLGYIITNFRVYGARQFQKVFGITEKNIFKTLIPIAFEARDMARIFKSKMKSANKNIMIKLRVKLNFESVSSHSGLELGRGGAGQKGGTFGLK